MRVFPDEVSIWVVDSVNPSASCPPPPDVTGEHHSVYGGLNRARRLLELGHWSSALRAPDALAFRPGLESHPSASRHLRPLDSDWSTTLVSWVSSLLMADCGTPRLPYLRDWFCFPQESWLMQGVIINLVWICNMAMPTDNFSNVNVGIFFNFALSGRYIIQNSLYLFIYIFSCQTSLWKPVCRPKKQDNVPWKKCKWFQMKSCWK